MVDVCAVPGCKQRTRSDPNITFHNFPLNSPELLNRWQVVMRRRFFKPSRHHRVCSRHFLLTDFKKSKKKDRVRSRYLKEGAVPSVFPPVETWRDLQNRLSSAPFPEVQPTTSQQPESLQLHATTPPPPSYQVQTVTTSSQPVKEELLLLNCLDGPLLVAPPQTHYQAIAPAETPISPPFQVVAQPVKEEFAVVSNASSSINPTPPNPVEIPDPRVTDHCYTVPSSAESVFAAMESKFKEEIKQIKSDTHSKKGAIHALQRKLLSMKDEKGEPLFKTVKDALDLRLYDLSDSEVRSVAATEMKKRREEQKSWTVIHAPKKSVCAAKSPAKGSEKDKATPAEAEKPANVDKDSEEEEDDEEEGDPFSVNLNYIPLKK